MPFKSAAQRVWMHTHHPKIARRWDAHTPKGKGLPAHVHDDLDAMERDVPATKRSELDGPLPSVWDFFGHVRDDGSGT